MLKLLASILSQPKENSNKTHELGNLFGNDNFFNLILLHRCTSYCYKFFNNHKSLIPPDILEKLKNEQLRNQQRMLLLAGETIKIVDILKQANIISIALKGPMLSLQLYNDFAMRSARDIDLLLQWKDIDSACEILKASGYNLFQPKKKPSNLNKNLYRHTLYDFMFVNPEIHVTVELHWSLAFHNYFKKSDDKGLETMIDYIIYNNHPIPVLNKQMQLLFLAVHGSKHKWSLLYWLKDFSDYLIQYSNPDEAMELSRKFKVEHSMLQGIYLSQMFSLYPGTLKNYPELNYVKKYLIPPALNEMELQPIRSAIYDIKNVFYFMKLRPGILYKTNSLLHMFYRFFIRVILRFF